MQEKGLGRILLLQGEAPFLLDGVGVSRAMGVGSGFQDTPQIESLEGQGLGFCVSIWKAFLGACSCKILAAAFRTPRFLGSLLPNFVVAAQVSQ